MCDSLCRLFEVSTRLQRRDLSYDLYHFLWDAKERCETLKEYLLWAAEQQAAALRGCVVPQEGGHDGSPGGGGFAVRGGRAPSFGVFGPGRGMPLPVLKSKWHKAGPIGGGILAAMDNMLVWDSAAEGFKANRLAQLLP